MAFELTRKTPEELSPDALIRDGEVDRLRAVRQGLFRPGYQILVPPPSDPGDLQALTGLYLEALEAAVAHRCARVVLTPLGVGSGSATETTVRAAVRAASIFLRGHDVSIVLSLPEGLTPDLGDVFYASLAQYIAQRYVGAGGAIFEHRFYRAPPPPPPSGYSANRAQTLGIRADAAAPAAGLEDLIKNTDAGFSETLLTLIDRSGRTDPDVYRRANVDRKLFSKIRSNPAYRPSKTTALAFAVALELDLDATRDLISRAGYSLTHASRADIIVEYFITRGRYDIFEINEALFSFDQPLLGGA